VRPTTALRRTGLPEYVKPLARHLSDDAIRYLRRINALSIPRESIRNALFNAFFKYLHPCLPVLDATTFRDALDGRGEKKISLLLLQVLIFAGSTVGSRATLASTVLGNEQETCRELFNGAKVSHHSRPRILSIGLRSVVVLQMLYAFDCEDDPFVLTQCLLLMSFCEETEGPKSVPYWVGCAVSQLDSILSDSQASTSEGPRSSQMALHKALWWTCYIRDRTIASSLHLLAQLQNNCYDIASLNVHQFQVASNSTSGASIPRQDRDSVDESTFAAAIFIEHVVLLSLIQYAAHLGDDPRERRVATWAETLNWDTHLHMQLECALESNSRTGEQIQLGMLHWQYNVAVLELEHGESATDTSQLTTLAAIKTISRITD
jgi:hypothetical protein